MTKNDPHFRLLLEVLGFWNTESEPQEADGAWVYPPSELPSTIEPLLASLKENLAFPPTDLGDMKTLVRRVYKRRAASPSSDEDSDDGEGGAERPKRKRRRPESDEPRAPRRQKAQEVQTYKSAAFIWDSDDDEEADAAFFAREAQLRAEMGRHGQEAEEEVRAIMEGKTLRKAKASSPVAEDEEMAEEDEETVQQRAQWKALRKAIMQEWLEHDDDEWRPSDHAEWQGAYTDRDDEEFLLRKAGNWDSDAEGPINSLDSDSEDGREPAAPASRQRSRAAVDTGADSDVEDAADKENQPPASATTGTSAARTSDDEGDKENRPPVRAKLLDEPMDEDVPMKAPMGSDDESAAPVARRRRVVESDDED